MNGPLQGVQAIEVADLAPKSAAAMRLIGHDADVEHSDRFDESTDPALFGESPSATQRTGGDAAFAGYRATRTAAAMSRHSSIDDQERMQ